MADGTRVLLGTVAGTNEAAKFCLRVMNDLHNRDVEDIRIAIVDGLKDLPDAVTAASPR